MRHSFNYTVLSGRQTQTKADDYQTAIIPPSGAEVLTQHIKNIFFSSCFQCFPASYLLRVSTSLNFRKTPTKEILKRSGK